MKLARRMTALLLALGMMISFFTGCAEQQDREEPSDAREETEPGQQPAANAIPIGNPDNFLLYRYQSSYWDDIRPVFLPMPRQVGETLDKAQLFQFATENDIRGWLHTQLWDFSFELVDDTATFHLSSMPEDDDPARLPLVNSGKDARFYNEDMLFTIWATLTQNETGIDQVRFLYDGEPFQAKYIALDSNGYVTETQIPLLGYTTEEVEELRLRVPYEESALLADLQHSPPYLPVLQDTPELRQITGLIDAVNLFNTLEESFNTPGEAPEDFVLTASIGFSTCYSWRKFQHPGEFSEAELEVLNRASAHYQGVLQEHVEQTAQLLFGEEAEVHHMSGGLHTYMETAGMYVPPDQFPYQVIAPVVLDYQELDDRYEVTVVFVRYHSFIPAFVNELGHDITEEEAMQYAWQEAPRHQITLLKGGELGLTYYAHQLPHSSGQQD